MQVTLAQQGKGVSADLDLSLVLRVEEHPVTDFHGADVRADPGNSSPGEPTTHRGCRGDDDACRRPPLTGLGVEGHEHAVVQHPDRQLVIGRLTAHQDALLS